MLLLHSLYFIYVVSSSAWFWEVFDLWPFVVTWWFEPLAMAKHKIDGGSRSLRCVCLLFCVPIISEVPSPGHEFNEAKPNGQIKKRPRMLQSFGNCPLVPLGSRLKAMDKPEQPAVRSRKYQKNPSEQPPSATVSMSWFRLFKARRKSSCMAGLNWRYTAETVWNSLSLLHTAVHCSVHANLTAHLIAGHQLNASQSLSFPHTYSQNCLTAL